MSSLEICAQISIVCVHYIFVSTVDIDIKEKGSGSSLFNSAIYCAGFHARTINFHWTLVVLYIYI